MGFDQYPNNYEDLSDCEEVPGIWASAKDVLQGAMGLLKEMMHQISAADLNQKESSLRWSQAPREYLPQAPDYPPIHDDSL